MVAQQKEFYLETGKWTQYDTFIEQICKEHDYTKHEAESKLDTLISNRDVEMMHISNNKYINFDSAVSYYSK